jgi:hypothetical protein
MTATNKEQNHAEQNARAWVENIAEMIAKLDKAGAAKLYADNLTEDERLKFLTDNDVTYDPEMDDAAEMLANLIVEDAICPPDFEWDEDSARQEIQESPLSLQVRSGWVSPGEEMEASEFEILLSTGGPALRIRGELDEHKQPDRAWLEYQDWGTPWTQYFDVEQDTLLQFCQVFYFGE